MILKPAKQSLQGFLNPMYFDLTNDSWCCARPSGTEPKIKFYMGVKGTSLENAQVRLEKLTEDLKAYL